MTQTMKPAANRPTTQTDSLFGMALTQAFMGFAFGADVDMAFEAGEIASAVYVDRRTNGNKGNFQLGVNNSLQGMFTRSAHQTLAEMERETFRPSNLQSRPTSSLSLAA